MLARLEASAMPADAVEVGRIADPWGIKGWFKVLAYSSSPQALFSSKQWYLLSAERGPRTFLGALKLRIKEARDHSAGVVASAHEVEDRTVAECLRGARIFVPRSSFPSTGTDEYYWVDLIGLEVVNRQGVVLGNVVELLSTNVQAVLVLQDRSGATVLARMIPFVSAFVDDVDLAGRRITVAWPAEY